MIAWKVFTKSFFSLEGRDAIYESK